MFSLTGVSGDGGGKNDSGNGDGASVPKSTSSSHLQPLSKRVAVLLLLLLFTLADAVLVCLSRRVK